METVVRLLSRAHTLNLLRQFIVSPDEPKRYHELQSRLDISSSTLSIRLAELVEAGFLTRISFDEIPPHVEFEATRMTRDLTDVFRAIHGWSDQHDVPPLEESSY